MELNRRAEDAEDAAPPPPPPAAGVCMWRWAGGWPGARQARRRRGIGAAQGDGAAPPGAAEPPRDPPGPPARDPSRRRPAVRTLFKLFFIYFFNENPVFARFFAAPRLAQRRAPSSKEAAFFFFSQLILFIYLFILSYLFIYFGGVFPEMATEGWAPARCPFPVSSCKMYGLQALRFACGVTTSSARARHTFCSDVQEDSM